MKDGGVKVKALQMFIVWAATTVDAVEMNVVSIANTKIGGIAKDVQRTVNATIGSTMHGMAINIVSEATTNGVTKAETIKVDSLRTLSVTTGSTTSGVAINASTGAMTNGGAKVEIRTLFSTREVDTMSNIGEEVRGAVTNILRDTMII